MRGNALGFTWKEGAKINKTGSNTWQAVITYQSANDGFRCQHCSDNSDFIGSYFQYRIYIDDRIDMIGGNMQVRIPISKSSSYFDDTPKYFAYPWFFSKEGNGTAVSIESPQTGRNFSIVIYRPPSFEENTFKTYPTVLVFDLSEEIYKAVATIMAAPTVEKGTIGEYILIGFGDYTSQDDRTNLLTQVPGPSHECINGTYDTQCDNCFPAGINYTEYIWYMTNKCGKQVETGGKGNETLDFLLDTVIPKVKNITNMRMLTDQPNLGIMGYSLGGLMACHAAWTRPNIFGFAACQSPSFWWPYNNDFSAGDFFFINVTLKDETLRNHRSGQRIYLDAGGKETYLPFTLTQAMLFAAQDMENTAYFEWDKNLWANVFSDDPHSFTYWAMRIWNPLKIFFPTYPSPSYNRDTHADCNISGSRRKHISFLVEIICILIALQMRVAG